MRVGKNLITWRYVHLRIPLELWCVLEEHAAGDLTSVNTLIMEALCKQYGMSSRDFKAPEVKAKIIPLEKVG